MRTKYNMNNYHASLPIKCWCFFLQNKEENDFFLQNDEENDFVASIVGDTDAWLDSSYNSESDRAYSTTGKHTIQPVSIPYNKSRFFTLIV